MKPFIFIKKIFSLWPIFGLLFFLIWAVIYILPMLPADFISMEKAKNLFKEEEEWVHPDEKYQFFYSQEKLKPKTLDELYDDTSDVDDVGNVDDVAVETLKLGVSTPTPTLTTTIVSNASELQVAIKNASFNDIIELKPGIYKTKLFIDKDLTIMGQVSTTTIIIGGDSGTAIYAKDCILNLSYFTITNSNSAIKTSNASGKISNIIIENNKKSGIELRNSKFTIKNNIITKNGSYGVFADVDSALEIADNYVDGNKGFQVRIEGEKEIYR